MKPWRIAIAMLVVALCAVSTYVAYINVAPAEPGIAKSTPASTSPGQPSSPLPGTATNVTSEKQKANRYLESHERLRRYDAQWPVAEKVAVALLKGTFGHPLRYASNNMPMSTGFSGWGGVMTPDKSVEAIVYWRNGTADLKMGVRGFTLYSVTISAVADNMPRYQATLTDNGVKRTTTTEGIGVLATPNSKEWQPSTLAELTDLDNQVVAALTSEVAKAKL